MSAFKLLPIILLATVAISASADGGPVYLKDLIKVGCSSIPDCIKLIVEYMVKIAFPVAVVFIIWSGFLFVSAQGDEKKLTTARSTLTATVIGLAIVIGAWALAVAFKNFFEGL